MTGTTGSGDAPRLLLQGVYALVDPARVEPIGFVEALLRGGIRLIQIRAKDGIDGATLIAIVGRVRAAGGITIVNDDVRLARLADGVHLGQEDAAELDLREVRRGLRGGVVGLSAGTLEELRAVDPALVDYLGVGPAYATGTKADAGAPIGAAGVRAVVAATTLPCAAIGGITRERLAEMRATGAAMAAVLGALVCADPEEAARDLVAAWHAGG